MARRWLIETIRPLRSAFAQVAVVSAFVNLLAIAVPVFVLQVYDRVVMHAGLSTLYGLITGVAVAILFDFVLRQFRARLLQSTALEIDIAVSRRVFEKLLALPLRVLERRPASYWQTLFRDAAAVRDTFSGATAIAVADLPFAVLFLVVIGVIAAPIAWVVLVLLPVFVGLAWAGARRQGRRIREERDIGLDRDALLAEISAGRATIKGLALDGASRDRWETAHASALRKGLERGRTGDNFLNAGLAVTVVSTVAITGVGALAILDHRLTIGALIATNMLASRIILPFQQLINAWRSFTLCEAASERLGELFALPGERAHSAVRFERPVGRLTFDNVSFRYLADAEPVIDRIGLTLEPRGMYGIMGANGSGKTTLLKLALGLYAPDDGRVLIDGADIAQFSRGDMSRWMGYVPQDVRLFAGTIRDNVAVRRPDADDAEVVGAAQLAGVHDFIASLPDGYGTEVGDGGAALPGGIRQKIGIARALLDRPPFLVMDEPSSNLDRESAAALARTLRELASAHTVVMATHSPALLSACHSILVLDRGRIARGGEARQVLPELFVTPAAARGHA